MMSLKELYLNNNQLTAIPPEIKKLVKLKKLNLSYNELTTLPIGIENLHSLMILDLRGNNIAESGDGTTTVGKTELRQRFGDQVMFDSDTIEFEQEEISK